MIKFRFIKSISTRVGRGFHRDESGASLTEFVISLPVWIILFAGLLGLGKFGLNTTANQLETQTKIWDSVFTESDDAVHMTTASGGAAAFAKSSELAANSSNPHQVITGLNSLVMTPGLSLAGTWGESFGRAKPLQYIPLLDVPTVYSDPDDVVGGGGGFPLGIVNDGVAGADWSNDSGGSALAKVMNQVANVVSGSGVLAAVAAGNRYGEVYAETESDPIDVWIGDPVIAHSHANMLVGPSPLTGGKANYLPFALARIMAEGESEYAVMMNFGESEWEGGSGEGLDIGDDPTGELDEAEEDSEEGIEEEKEKQENGD